MFAWHAPADHPPTIEPPAPPANGLSTTLLLCVVHCELGWGTPVSAPARFSLTVVAAAADVCVSENSPSATNNVAANRKLRTALLQLHVDAGGRPARNCRRSFPRMFVRAHTHHAPCA